MKKILEQLRECAVWSMGFVNKRLGVIAGTVADALEEMQRQIDEKAPASHGKHIPSGGSSGQILRWSSDGTAAWGADSDTKPTGMKGATASAAGAAGYVPAPAAGANGKYLRGDGTWQTPPDTNTTYGNMSGATTSADGKAGLAPAPAAGAANRYLRSDGTWAVPPDNNTTYGAVTQSAPGLMSAADKKKLDGVAAGANAYTHPSAHAASMITQDATHRFVTDTEKNAWNAKPSAASVTIPTTGWGSDSTAGYPAYYDITVAGVTVKDRANVTIAVGSLATAEACGMCPTNETLAGKIRIRAVSVPTAAISAEYWIEKGKE